MRRPAPPTIADLRTEGVAGAPVWRRGLGFALLALFATRVFAASPIIARPDDESACRNSERWWTLDQQIEGCTALIELRSKSRFALAWAYRSRANAYKKKGNFPRAIADYDTVIKINPQDGLMYIFRGLSHAAKGDYDRAIADYSKALQLNPKNNAAAYLYRGYAYTVRRDNDRAIADYNKTIELDKKHIVLAYIYRAYNYVIKGAYDLAIADCDRAIELDQNNALAYLTRGEAYAGKGDRDQAIADYNKTLALDYKNSTAWNLRHYQYEMKNREREALNKRLGMASDHRDEPSRFDLRTVLLLTIIQFIAIIYLANKSIESKTNELVFGRHNASKFGKALRRIAAIIFLLSWLHVFLSFLIPPPPPPG
ncbi:MAG: tetratricopeptide repeat protein [Methylocystis sp.]|uniref:tetratricopeptide repeat protein n=1 Tax=Methylocystis sp. TaxID=1911079 RepID=UPI003D0A8513